MVSVTMQFHMLSSLQISFIGYVEGCTNTNRCSASAKKTAPLSFSAEKAHFYDLLAVTSIQVTRHSGVA